MASSYPAFPPSLALLLTLNVIIKETQYFINFKAFSGIFIFSFRVILLVKIVFFVQVKFGLTIPCAQTWASADPSISHPLFPFSLTFTTPPDGYVGRHFSRNYLPFNFVSSIYCALCGVSIDLMLKAFRNAPRNFGRQTLNIWAGSIKTKMTLLTILIAMQQWR